MTWLRFVPPVGTETETYDEHIMVQPPFISGEGLCNLLDCLQSMVSTVCLFCWCVVCPSTQYNVIIKTVMLTTMWSKEPSLPITALEWWLDLFSTGLCNLLTLYFLTSSLCSGELHQHYTYRCKGKLKNQKRSSLTRGNHMTRSVFQLQWSLKLPPIWWSAVKKQ